MSYNICEGGKGGFGYINENGLAFGGEHEKYSRIGSEKARNSWLKKYKTDLNFKKNFILHMKKISLKGHQALKEKYPNGIWKDKKHDENTKKIREELLNQGMYPDEDEEDEEDDYDENYLQKIDDVLKKNIIEEHHPEMISHNYEEVEALCRVVRDEYGVIMDPLHKTMPFITKYEKAKLLGERSKQINAGAQPTVVVDD